MRFFLLLFLLFISYSQSIIKLPFQKEKQILKDENDFIDIFLKNNLIYELNIGTPTKKIPINLILNYHNFFLYGTELKGLYDEKISSSYKNNSDYEITFEDENFNVGFLSLEKVNFNDENNKIKEYNNISFILATRNTKENKYNNVIGLTIFSNSKILKGNLLYGLKLNKIIPSLTFYFKYNDNKKEKGEILIGDSPHNYDKSFSIEHFKFIPLEISKYSNFNWNIVFEKIHFGDFGFVQNNLFLIDFNVEGIIADDRLMKIFENHFFNSLIENKKCFKNEKKYNDKYYYFYCDKGIDLKGFKKVFFYSQVIDFNFTFDSNDLFIEKNDKLYFMIVFSFQNKRILGNIFMKKYNTLFDQERKYIGFYFGKNSTFSFYWFFIFILFILALLLSYSLYKSIGLKKRKMKANELEENLVLN